MLQILVLSLSQYCNFSSYILKSVDQQKQVTRYYF